MFAEKREYLIGGIQKFSISDGPGIRTTVFVKGCSLNCQWCHNPELIHEEQEIIYTRNRCIGDGNCIKNCSIQVIKASKERGIVIDRNKCNSCLKCIDVCYSGALRTAAKSMTCEEIMSEVIKDKQFYMHTNGGLTLSGGEVMKHPDFAIEMTRMAQAENIGVALDTSGYCDRDLLITLAKKSQIVLYDIKSIDDNIHKTYTGASNAVIIENLIALANNKKTKSKVQIRMPLIHGVNDSEAIISQTADFLTQYGLSDVVLLPYHVLGESKRKGLGVDSRKFEPPNQSQMDSIIAYFASRGIHTVKL